MKCGSDGNFTNMFLVDGKYQNLSLYCDIYTKYWAPITFGPPAVASVAY
jgi:hypothetical protein